MTIEVVLTTANAQTRNVYWRRLFKLPVHGDPHDPHFTIADVAAQLTVPNPYAIINRWTPNEIAERVITLPIRDKIGRTQKTKVFTETGLTHFVFRSKSAEAKRVQAEMVRAVEEYRRKYVVTTAEIALDMGVDVSIKHYHPGLFERHPVVLWFHWYSRWRAERDVAGISLGAAIVLFCEFYGRWTAGQRYLGPDGQRYIETECLLDLALEAEHSRDGAPFRLPFSPEEAWNAIRCTGFAPRLDIKTLGEMEERLGQRLLNTNAEAYNDWALLSRENGYFMDSDTPEGKRKLDQWLARNVNREAGFKVPLMPWNTPWWRETVRQMGGNGDKPSGRGLVCAKGVSKVFGVPVYKLRELARPGGSLGAARPWAIVDSHGHLKSVAEYALLEIAGELAPRLGDGPRPAGAKSFVDAEWMWTIANT